MKSSPTDIYSLSAAPGMQDGIGPRIRPTRLLQAQIRRGFRALRFGNALESDFCRYLRVSGRLSRASLITVSFVGILVIILIDQALLGVPGELVRPTRLLELGVMMPVVVFCGFFCWRWPYSRYIEGVMLLMFVGMNVGMMGQRVVASHHGFDVPAEMVGVTIVAMFSLARIRFWLMLPAAIVATAAAVATELLFVDAGANAYYHLFAASLLLTIGVMGGYSSEYFIRWTWLNGTLLRYMSRLDSLTGLLNRQALEDALEKSIAHAYREKIDYAIAMIDIDAFGAYNDYYGHQAGDVALSEVAYTLDSSTRRPLDVCGRFGGEEFVLLWMDGNALELTTLAEQTRAAVEQNQIPHAASTVAPWVTASVGVCHVSSSDGLVSLKDVLGKADRLLYEGKARGRNRVVSERFVAAPVARRASG
ncbi:GGDEF domain-containing protein [Salinisphaera aquimarina]|uniref:diguanylate cyclase n=1 Tax=Salinisphaera aquimarina TaxID=2094031 RepID=A0ABV7EMI3_9GAMM